MLPRDTAAIDERVGRHTIEVRVRDKPAAIDRVVGMLRHRRFRLESITVHAAIAGMNRITLILQDADPSVVVERLHRLVDVSDVIVLESTTPITQFSGEHDGKTVL